MHEIRERQSLALHREIAARLRRDSALLEHARANLTRWIARHGDGPLLPAYRVYEDIMLRRIAALPPGAGEGADLEVRWLRLLATARK
jgi:hypothetical protein